MNQPTVSMMDLPDEILLIIWNKLNKIDILYSFIGVNKRFDKLVRDVVYTRSIELIKTNSTDDDHSLPELILNQFCLSILPQIHHYIECLTLEPFSMKRILNSGNYPKLSKLTLLNFEQEFAWDYFTGKIRLFSFCFFREIYCRYVTFRRYFQKTDYTSNRSN